MAAAEALDECVSGADDAGRAEPFEAPHRPQPGFEPSVIGFDRVIGVLLQDMAHRGQQLSDYSRVGGRLIGADGTVALSLKCPGGDPDRLGRVPWITERGRGARF